MEKLSIKDIKKSITNKIKQLNINVYANEVEEGFITPCFFISIEKFENSLENSNFVKKYLDIYVRYINENITDIEKLEMMENLNELFLKTISVKNRTFTINNKSFSKNKKDYLELNFGIEYFELLLDEEELNSEKMQEVKLDF